jgi:hypothetical protein
VLQVKQTQARKTKLFQQPLVQILALDERDLLRSHLAAVHRKLAVYLSTKTQKQLVAGVLQ